MRQSSESHEAVIRVIRELSGSHQEVIRKSSKQTKDQATMAEKHRFTKFFSLNGFFFQKVNLSKKYRRNRIIKYCEKKLKVL